MKLKRMLFLLLMIGLFMQIFAIYKVAYANGNSEGSIKAEDTKEILSGEEIDVLKLVNNYRKEQGLEKLKISIDLQKVAEMKAKDLVDSNQFSHTSPNFGKTFNIIKQENIAYKIAGENLAGNINPENAVNAWINSTTHRKNIEER